MNSRERVLKALRHQEPDRVPLDSGGCSATTIAAVPYSKLKRLLGIREGTVSVYDVILQVAMPEQWYLDRFEVDVVDVTREYCLDTSDWQDWELSDGSMGKIPSWIKLERDNGGWIYRDAGGDILGRMPAGGHFFDQTYWPLADAGEEEYAHPERYLGKTLWAVMPRPLMHLSREPQFPKLLGDAAKKLYETTDYAIMLNAGVSLYEAAQFLCRTDNLVADMVTNGRKVRTLLDRLLELNISALERLLEFAGPYIHVIKINDDLGMQTGPQMSLRMFREFFKPRHKAMYETIRKKAPDVFIFLHSCGSVYRFLPDLLDIGLDILNPVQTTAAGMDPHQLKEEFGKDLTFWGGGVDTQKVLPRGTREEIINDVAEKVRIFAPGGGYIFTQSHNIAPEVPPENVLAMFEGFHRVRDYPVGR